MRFGHTTRSRHEREETPGNRKVPWTIIDTRLARNGFTGRPACELQRFLADEAADEFELMPAVDCMRISLGQSKDQNGQGEADERLPLLAADSSPSNTEEPSQESFENHTDSSKPPS